MRYRIHLGDSFAWLEAREENSIHAIVTDPPTDSKNIRRLRRQNCAMDAGESGASLHHLTVASEVHFQGSRSWIRPTLPRCVHFSQSSPNKRCAFLFQAVTS